MYLIRNYLGVWTAVAGDERLWHRESSRSSINNTDTFYRVLCITYNIWLITVLITNLFSTFLAFHFWTRMPSYRRNEVKCWTLSTRCLPRESLKVICHFIFMYVLYWSRKDLRGEIVKVAAFLNQTPTDEQLDKITEHLRFDNFEKNESVNNEPVKKLGLMNLDGKFIRKGKNEMIL